ncbi:MAG TPA: sigma-70 family RNA polymerase sigma factor [Gaiellaceae bacterium]|nr:sigma-70 family RNA polymerase sigma factor [Gaiellaceae bacterium]
MANPARSLRRVYAYVAYRLGDGPDAEDVTGEVLENALRYRASFDPARGAPDTWLLGIARRCVSHHLSSRVTLAESPEIAAAGNLEAEAVERIALESALGRLSERDRDLLALRYGADLKERRIAEILELSTGAVEVALHRARNRLRAEIEAQEAPQEAKSSDRSSFVGGVGEV